MERKDKPTSRPISKIIAESDALIRHGQQTINNTEELMAHVRQLLSRSSLATLGMLLSEHRKDLPDDRTFRILSQNIKALQQEMAAGSRIDPALITQIEQSIHRLARQYDMDEFSCHKSVGQ